MRRVEITRPVMGLCQMQVCAVHEATDQEILEVCNRENPSGTTYGWVKVIRNDSDYPQCNPGPCAQYPERTHFLILC
jgi:hypothetical protein